MSQTYKISVSQTLNEHKWLREQTSKQKMQKGVLVGLQLAQ